MIQTVKAANRKELEEITQYKDLSISKIIINRITETIDNDEELVHIMDLLIEDEEVVLEVKLEKTEFKQALERNLAIHEKHEDYASCTKIKDLLNKYYNEH